MTTTHIDDDEIAVWVAGLREAIEREDGIVTETECPGCDDLLRERDDLVARLAAVRALCDEGDADDSGLVYVEDLRAVIDQEADRG